MIINIGFVNFIPRMPAIMPATILIINFKLSIAMVISQIENTAKNIAIKIPNKYNLKLKVAKIIPPTIDKAITIPFVKSMLLTILSKSL